MKKLKVSSQTEKILNQRIICKQL